MTPAELAALSNTLKTSLADGFRNVAAGQSHLTREVVVFSQSAADAADRLDEFEARTKKNIFASKEQERMQRRHINALSQEIKLQQRLREDEERLHRFQLDHAAALAAGSTTHLDQQQQLNSAINNTRANLIANQTILNQTSVAVNGFGGRLGSLSKGILPLIGILSYLGHSFLSYNKSFLEATTKSAGVIEANSETFDGSMNKWTAVLRTGGDSYASMNQMTALELMAANRQMVNAVGGITNAIELTDKANKDFRGFYGTLEDAARANLSILSNFAVKGVRPSTNALLLYNKDLTLLAKQTGLAAPVINDMINSIAEDTDSLTILRAARDGEREAILANQRALLKSNIALGMNAQQASEAAKMLNKMVAQKPLERLKQAAKMRALGAAMGLGSEAEKASRAVIHGKQATETEREDLNRFNVLATGLMDTASQQGMAQELFTSTLLDKLDLDQYYGPGSVFSTTLGNINAKTQADTEAMYQSSTNSNIVAINNVADIATNMLQALLDGTLLWAGILQEVSDTGLLGGVLYTLEAIVAGWSDIFSMMGNLGSKIVHLLNPLSSASASEVPYAVNASIALQEKQKESLQRQKQAEQITTASIARKKEEAANKQLEYSKKEFENKDQKEKTTMARIKNNNEVPTVNIANNISKETTEKRHNTKTEETMSDQLALSSIHVNRIDEQLKQMNTTNDYLKKMAIEDIPTLVDLAGKQLAISTMDEMQRERAASRLRTETSKFNADYSYGGM